MRLGGSVLIGVALSLLISLSVFFWVPGGSANAQDTADPVLVGAGDIAKRNSAGDEATASLLDHIPGTVFTTGDNAYDFGSTADFNVAYEPSWGRHKARTMPSVGNHEYYAPLYDKQSNDYDEGAADYFAYFGAAAGEPSKGYYSYNLGDWHIVVLNSCLEYEPAKWDDSSPPKRTAQVKCLGPGSLQEQWLADDLAAPENQGACTLAYWHHPRFSSGSHGNSTSVAGLWSALYRASADVVINGHDHVYERFAPQNSSGQADPDQGIREFVVGTGGGDLTQFKTIRPNSEARIANKFGVLKLILHPEGYDWQFRTVDGMVEDSGSDSCHGAPTASDTTPPAVQPPVQDLPTGGTLGTSTVPTKISWSASDESGVARYDLQQSVNGGTFRAVSLPSATATAKTLQLQPGSTYEYRVSATDTLGNTSDWYPEDWDTRPPFLVDLQQEDSAIVQYVGAWTQQASTSSYGGGVKHSSTKGSTAQFTFTGQNVAWVTTKGPNMGKATVSVDGVVVRTIDLYSSTTQPRKMVFSQSGLDPAVSHTVAVQVLGTKRSASSGTRVDVDAFVALR